MTTEIQTVRSRVHKSGFIRHGSELAIVCTLIAFPFVMVTHLVARMIAGEEVQLAEQAKLVYRDEAKKCLEWCEESPSGARTLHYRIPLVDLPRGCSTLSMLCETLGYGGIESLVSVPDTHLARTAPRYHFESVLGDDPSALCASDNETKIR